jgi:hypothetical protein
MEHENAYASKGVGNTALGLSIGALGAELLGGNLSGLLGGTRNGDSGYVNRYEAAQAARIAELETDVKLRDANIYTDSKILEVYKYMDGKFARVEHELCDQRVFNTTAINNISCVQGQIAQLMALTKLVVPNTSVCPGWGDVTVSITPATTT